MLSLLIVYALIAITTTIAQDIVCVDSSNFTLTSQIAELCIPFLQGAVFVNITQQSVDRALASTLRILQLAPNSCAVKTIELTCQTYYPRCTVISTPYALIPLPSPSCKFKCLNAIAACTSFVQENHQIFEKRPDLLPLDCNVQDGGVERWPTSYAVYNISGLRVEVNCNSYTTDEYVETKPDSCPYVMDVVGSPPPTEAPCRVKCPLPLFPQENWESDMHWAKILAWISLICAMFLIISFSLVKHRRRFPQNLFINLFVSCVMLSIFVIMSTSQGRKLMCHKDKPSTQYFAPCGLQGSMMFFFALCGSCWWFSIVVNLFIMTNSTKKEIPYRNEKYYYIFSYGFPAVMLITALSLKGFGFYAPNIICFLPVAGPQEWMQYALYYGPIGLLTLVGAILNIIVIFKLLKAYFTVAKKVDRNMSPYFKVALFGIFFLFLWAALFTRMGVANNTDVDNSFIDFVICHMTYFSLNLDSVQHCATVPKIQPNIKILHIMYIAQTIHGTLAFFLFCYEKDLYLGWLAAFKRGRKWMEAKMEERRRKKEKERERRGERELEEVRTNSSSSMTAIVSEPPSNAEV